MSGILADFGWPNNVLSTAVNTTCVPICSITPRSSHPWIPNPSCPPGSPTGIASEASKRRLPTPGDRSSWPAAEWPIARSPDSPKSVLQIPFDALRFDRDGAVNRANALGRLSGRHRPPADLDPQLFAVALLAGLSGGCLVRLEDAEPPTLSLGIRASEGFAEGQGFLSAETKALREHCRPQRQNRRSVGRSGSMTRSGRSRTAATIPRRRPR
jgi:hypothetical protein